MTPDPRTSEKPLPASSAFLVADASAPAAPTGEDASTAASLNGVAPAPSAPSVSDARRDKGRLTSASDALASLPSRVARFVSDERQWLWVVIPYLLAWGVPRIGERFAGWGPLRWEWGWWSNPDSVLHFQFWILPGFLGLIWMDRARLSRRWAGLSYHFTDKNRRLRSGMKLLTFGAILLILSNLVSLAAVAIIGMVCITAGIVRRVYGPAMFKAMATPFLFLLLIIPPPETVAAKSQMFCMKASNSFAAAILNLLGKKAVALPNDVFTGSLNVNGHIIVTSERCHGAGIASLVFAFTLWYLIATRARAFWAVITLILSLCFALLLHGLRVVGMGLTSESNPAFGNALQSLFPYLLVAPALAMTYLANRYAIPVFAEAGKKIAKLSVVTRVTGRFTDRLAGRAAARLGAVGQITAGANKATDRAMGAVGKGMGGVWGVIFSPFQSFAKKRRSALAQSRWTKKRGRRKDW